MRTKNGFLITLLGLIALAGCTFAPAGSNNDDSFIATAVESQLQTQAAEDLAAQAEQAQADYPAKSACTELSALLEQHLGMEVTMEAANFSDPASGIDGPGCQLSLGGTGEQVSDWGPKTANFSQALPNAGWVMDPNFSGGGAGGELLTLRKDEHACLYISEVRPESMSLCSDSEALVACLDRLEPAYIQYDITIGCTPDSYIPPAVDPGPAENQDSAIRITFDPGKTSAYANGRLEASSSQLYVLYAQEGQEMVVSLHPNPPLNGIIIVYGKDGTVLISDHATTEFWSGILPSTQDYFISVRSSPDYPIRYSIEVIIPPVGELHTGDYNPMDYSSCQSLADLIGGIMGVQTQTSTALFTDHLASTAGLGCKVTAWGTWDQFADHTATGTVVQDALVANGWQEAPEYGAGGAGGFLTGYTQGSSLCLYSQYVTELDPWVCDSFDGPIYTCWDEQDDSGMVFGIEMNCANPN